MKEECYKESFLFQLRLAGPIKKSRRLSPRGGRGATHQQVRNGARKFFAGSLMSLADLRRPSIRQRDAS